MIVILNNTYKNAVSETNTARIVKDGSVERFKNTRSFIIKFSSLIYEKDGQELKIPIFQGNMGDVSYDNFRQYCLEKKYLEPNVAETSFIIKAKKGELTKTFREFLNFYKGNILKNVDINKPAKLKVDGGALGIYYNFEVNGVPFVLQVDVSTDQVEIENIDLIKSIINLNLDEKMETPIFTYRFWDDYTSDEL